MFFCTSASNFLKEAKRLCSERDAEEFHLNTLGKEISILEKELSSDSQPVGFCHNDLQYGNIMMDEETKSLTIIVSFILLFTCYTS